MSCIYLTLHLVYNLLVRFFVSLIGFFFCEDLVFLVCFSSDFEDFTECEASPLFLLFGADSALDLEAGFRFAILNYCSRYRSRRGKRLPSPEGEEIAAVAAARGGRDRRRRR
jgi:hypothetical protein